MTSPGNLAVDLASGVGTFLGTAAISGLTNYYVLAEWRRLAGEHWTVRARALFRARAAAVVNFALFIAIAFLIGGCFTDDFPWAATIGGFLGAMAGMYPGVHAYFPHLTVRAWLTSVVLALSFRALDFGLLVAAVACMPPTLGLNTWLIAGSWIGFQLEVDLGLWLRWLRLIGFLRVPSPRVSRIVNETSAWSGVSVQAVWEAPAATCQIITFPTARTLVLTAPLVERLSDPEIEAICLHGLARLGEAKSVARRLRALALFARTPLLFLIPAQARFGPAGPSALIVLYLGLRFSLIRLRVRMGIRAEYVARTAGSYFNLYDRMIAAGVNPEFPRPLKPGRFHWTSAVLAGLVLTGFLLTVTLSSASG